MNKPFVELLGIQKSYRTGFRRSKQVLDNVSLYIERGEIVGLVGQSGSGKTTLGMILAGLLRHDAGELHIDGHRVQAPYAGALRREIQILFQHPETSFNPRIVLETSMKEPYWQRGMRYCRQEVLETLARYGMTQEHLGRQPSQLSGGELQRLAIIRALAMSPAFMVLDEPTSMLDIISQAQILGILKELSIERNMAYLFITHDLDAAQSFCDRILQIQNGTVEGFSDKSSQ
jgi:peptide/nickel transport system ATP-binding protein